MLVDSGVHLAKFWFSATRHEQRTRWAIRQLAPVRRWKLSNLDLLSLDRWGEYTKAKNAMFARADKRYPPWPIVRSSDKKRARLNAMRYFLTQFDGAEQATDVIGRTGPALRSSREAGLEVE